MKKLILPLLLLSSTAFAQSKLRPSIDQKAAAIETKVIDWRRDIHQNPELGNEETRTAKKVADHLRALGIEVQEGVATTGVARSYGRSSCGYGCLACHRARRLAFQI